MGLTLMVEVSWGPQELSVRTEVSFSIPGSFWTLEFVSRGL